MRKKIPTIIALLCILVYIAAILFAAYRVYTGIQDQRQAAEQELEGIGELITRNGASFFEESARSQIRDKITGSHTLEGLIITGSFGSSELIFERDQGKVVDRSGESPRFREQIGTGFLTRQVSVTGLRNVNIYAAYHVVSYDLFTLILKQTLLAILGALVIAFLTLILHVTLGRPSTASVDSVESSRRETVSTAAVSTTDVTSTASAAAAQTVSGNENIPDDLDDFGFSDFTGDIEDTADLGTDVPGDFTDSDTDFSETGSAAGSSDSGSGDSDDFKEDDFKLDDFLDEDELSLPDFEDLPEEPPAAEAPKRAEGEPKGLYSPRSNTGWEEYTLDRLSSELHRCAASEQDLVVMLIECGPSVNCGDGLYKKLAEDAVQFFNLKDLTFEKGKRGFAVIIPNANLDFGIIKAEEFHSRTLGAHPEAFASKQDFHIGITSRSGRLIDADRLLFEADNALAKAGEDSPIVAFRSDPEKYREFVRKGT